MLTAPLGRLVFLKATVFIAFVIGLVLSSPLWIGPRTYPLTPVWSGLPMLGHPLDLILYGALFTLGAAGLIAPRPRALIGTFLAIVAIFCLFDQTRWQPWVLLYAFMLAALGLFSWRKDDTEGQKRALHIAQLIVASTYFFAGVQKINSNFVNLIFPWMMQPVTDAVPALATPLYYFGIATPFIEAAFGIGLLTRRFRRISLIAAIGMHLLILAMLGPLGQNWNSIVWPWTAAMAIFDLLLFAGRDAFSWREIFPARALSFHTLVLLLFGILPILSFANLWDSYLSAALYSGNLTEAVIYATDAGQAALPADMQSRFQHTSDNISVLNMQRWAVEDLNVTPYSETRVFKAIARQLCVFEHDTDQFVLLVREERLLFSTPETGYRCGQL